jgi:hypothetical protein
MHLNGTAARARHQAGPVSPVISGEDGWLGDDDRDQPLTLRLELPVSATDLAAALYGYGVRGLCPDDLADDENVWGFAALAIVQDGLDTIQRRAKDIETAETCGTLASPSWLAACRSRVAEVTGQAAGAVSPPATTSAWAGAQPPSTATFHRPRTPQEETVPSRARHPR